MILHLPDFKAFDVIWPQFEPKLIRIIDLIFQFFRIYVRTRVNRRYNLSFFIRRNDWWDIYVHSCSRIVCCRVATGRWDTNGKRRYHQSALFQYVPPITVKSTKFFGR